MYTCIGESHHDQERFYVQQLYARLQAERGYLYFRRYWKLPDEQSHVHVGMISGGHVKMNRMKKWILYWMTPCMKNQLTVY